MNPRSHPVVAKHPSPGARQASSDASIPRPGGIFDPVGRALDAIGDRWTLSLIRQLLLGPAGFQELRKRTGIAPRVLSGRLRQLQADGLVETVSQGTRSQYAVSDRGRSLEPVVVALGRWWIQHGIADFRVDMGQFTQTSVQSVMDSLPLMLREDRASSAHVLFEVRLTGEGGGVWSIRIEDGACEVSEGSAARADVRYSADARTWCALALGRRDPREAVEQDLLAKQGGPEALDFYFHQLPQNGEANASPQTEEANASL